MLSKYLPFALAALLLVGLTLVEASFSDRWHDSSVDAVEFGKRFAQVPMDMGNWHGEDLEVEEDVRQTAGAVRYVSRSYTEAETGNTVTLWLIVGHARDVCRHTPNICYPNAGFSPNSSILKFHLPLPDGEEAVFNTARFEKSDELSQQIVRVFWSWNHPDRNRWEAPDNQRRTYGNSRALYKLYFTSTVMKGEETIEENTAVGFAKQMVPWINAALFGAEKPETQESSESTESSGAEVESPALEGSLESTDSELGAEPGLGGSLEPPMREGEPALGEPALGEPAGDAPQEGRKPEKSIYDEVS